MNPSILVQCFQGSASDMRAMMKQMQGQNHQQQPGVFSLLREMARQTQPEIGVESIEGSSILAKAARKLNKVKTSMGNGANFLSKSIFPVFRDTGEVYKELKQTSIEETNEIKTMIKEQVGGGSDDDEDDDDGSLPLSNRKRKSIFDHFGQEEYWVLAVLLLILMSTLTYYLHNRFTGQTVPYPPPMLVTPQMYPGMALPVMMDQQYAMGNLHAQPGVTLNTNKQQQLNKRKSIRSARTKRRTCDK